MNSNDVSDGDILLPVVILISVLLTRVSQTMREVSRLARSGFSASDIHGGLVGVMGERDQRRAELHADASIRQARHRTLIVAIMQLGLAVLFFFVALRFRFQLPNGNYQVLPAGMIFVTTSMILFGVSLALIFRSPFRRPLGELAYRFIWLGPIGQAFVRFSGRAAWKTESATGVSRPTTVPPWRQTQPPLPPPVVAPDRIEALEQRVSELERWRTNGH
jgi:hypothetical protein